MILYCCFYCRYIIAVSILLCHRNSYREKISFAYAVDIRLILYCFFFLIIIIIVYHRHTLHPFNISRKPIPHNIIIIILSLSNTITMNTLLTWLFVLSFKGAIQEMKIYASPDFADIQCTELLQVSRQLT